MAGVAAIPLELFYARRYAEKLSQMSASRAAGHPDSRWINIVFGRVRAKPANRRLHIVHCRRELIFRRQPILDGPRHKSPLRQLQTETVVSLPSTGPKTTAMNAEDRGQGASLRLFRTRQIKLQMLIVWVRVLKVSLENDIAWNN